MAIKSTGVSRYLLGLTITTIITIRYLLGLTITTGAVVSLPFLYYSDTVVKKVGLMLMVNNVNTDVNTLYMM